jgi:hypothetical protein
LNDSIAIWSAWASLTAQNNFIEGSSATWSSSNKLTYTGIHAESTIDKNILISGNVMSQMDFGISLSNNAYLYDPSTGTKIYSNAISINDPVDPLIVSATPLKYTYGISENEYFNRYTSNVVIGGTTSASANLIIGGMSSIVLQGATNTKILNNYLQLTDNSATILKYHHQSSVFAQNCNNVQVSANNFLGNGALYDDQYLGTNYTSSVHRKVGVAFENTTSSELCTNAFSSLGYSSYFTGMNASTRMRSNVMSDPTGTGVRCGVVLSNSNTVSAQIGDQGNATDQHHNNDFTGTFSSSYMTYVINPFGSQSAFYYKSSGGLDYGEPSNNGTTGALGTSLRSVPGSTTDPTCCDFTSTLASCSPDWFKFLPADFTHAVAAGNIYAYADSARHDGALWIAQRQLYRELMDDSTFLNSDTAYANFASAYASSDVAKTVSIDQYLYAIEQAKGDTLLADSLNYLSLISNALNVSKTMDATVIYSQNAQQLYNIYLATLAKGKEITDSANLAFVSTLAHSCPYDEGDAVYMARSIYSRYNSPQTGMPDDALCNPLDSSAIKHSKSSPKQAKDSLAIPTAYARIVPNPASNMTTLIYHNDAVSFNKLEIYDNLGRIIWSTSVTGSEGKVSIDLTGISEGIYLVRFTADDKLLLGTKLVVNK